MFMKALTGGFEGDGGALLTKWFTSFCIEQVVSRNKRTAQPRFTKQGYQIN